MEVVYNVGDKVVIRDDLVPYEEYGINCFIDDMGGMLGKTAEIEGVYGGQYKMVGNHYLWTSEMIDHVRTKNWVGVNIVYLAKFNNGESYPEEFSEWIDDKVYLDKDECIQSLLDLGYEYDSYDDYFDEEIYTLDAGHNWWSDERAMIVKLEVV